jgi:phosphonate transport system substrate-binding protein
MIARRLFIGLAATAALALTACGGAQEKPKNEITFSILSTEKSQNMEIYWTPILADMEKSTGLKVKPFFSSSYSALIEAMRFKQTDLGFDPSGTDGYTSVIIVPIDSPIKTLDDLLKCDKTLNFGMGDKKSTSGTLAPMTEVFIPRGVKPENCFKTVLTANHQSNLFAVANKRLDAATNNSTAIRLNQDRNEGQADKVRVIWESPVLPEDPIVWRKDLDPAVKEKVRQFFLTYGQGDTPEAAKQRENMKKLSIGGFKPADATHLLFVRKMEAMEQLGLAKEAGDQAKIAEATKSIQGIEAEQAKAAQAPAN